MRTASLPLQTARHAALAAVVSLAVAVPTPFIVDRFLFRGAEVPAHGAPSQTAVADGRPARSVAKTRAGRGITSPALPGPGLPGSVAEALKTHPFVVVALYAAGDPVDMAAGAEAEAGAALARVPYVAINVGDEGQIGDLASRLPTLTVPSVVLFGESGAVVTQLDGYVDRQGVAGAVDTARRP